MSKLDERTAANMDVVLEEACRIFPHGGDHEQRRRVAQKLMLSARKGNTTLGGLTAVASAAVQELTRADQKSSAANAASAAESDTWPRRPASRARSLAITLRD
jgi:hypothetical protein